MINLKHKKTGFTLIEVMVVIGIIGILSAVLFSNFSDARKISRDKARMTTLKEVQLALELYKAQNGEYPANGCAAADSRFVGPGPALVSPGYNFTSCDNYISGLVPDFISELPYDVFDGETGRGYYYRSNGSSFKFMAHDVVEIINVTSFGDEFARCPSSGDDGCLNSVPATTYAVYSAGAENW
jgi:prepilin-type N-terminal cleavage/methylation domain-containing protein